MEIYILCGQFFLGGYFSCSPKPRYFPTQKLKTE